MHDLRLSQRCAQVAIISRNKNAVWSLECDRVIEGIEQMLLEFDCQFDSAPQYKQSHLSQEAPVHSTSLALQIPVAAFTRAPESGRSLRRLPVASAMALATAAAAGP